MSTTQTSLPRPYIVTSLVTLVLTVVATAVGLLVPGFYRDAPVLIPQLYGQDLLTLVVAIPALAASLYYAVRGSLRAYIIWLGVTGYLLYTYGSYAFMTAFNELYLVYVALLGLTLYTFIGGMVRLDAAALRRRIGQESVRSYVAFQLLVGIMIVFLWLAEILPATLAGTTPPGVVEANLPVNVIHSLDLGVLIPAFVISAYWLWKRRAWGYVFTAVLLVKIATLGLAVLAMILFMVRDGLPVVLPQVIIFAVISLLALVLMARIVLSINPKKGSIPSASSPGRSSKTR